MLDDTALNDLANRIKSAQDRNQALDPLSAVLSLDVDSAYGIADRVHRMRLAQGARAVGRKIGFTNRNIWDEYGVHQPIWGWMYEHTVRHAASGRARIAKGRFAQPKIEPEIVLHLASAPPARSDVEGVLACIDWVAHGFEIVQSHFPDWKFRVEDTIADGGLHGALVIGEPVRVRELGSNLIGALAAFEIDLECDGEKLETGRGANVLGSPLNALAHLTTVLARLPGIADLAAGEIVTTGTLTAAYSIREGQQWRTLPRGLPLPGLALDIDA